MYYENNTAKDLKLAYIGGGSRGWAWILMNDLKKTTDMSGTVYLYDIDYKAAQVNEVIGNRIDGEGWKYKAVETIGEALQDADFVIISILPGTFDEMAVDVHTPEKYGIWQSVGDTAGPGGFIRALRTIPMIREIARNIRRYCPKAMVINYTNPMSVVIGTLYREFPEIKAYGCCHEVFGTQKLLVCALKEMEGIQVTRNDITVNVVGVNHFTWLTSAQYKNNDLMPMYRKLAEECAETGYARGIDENWMNNTFRCCHKVKFDLFNRFGVIAAAGDRHLAEFCPGEWYLQSPEAVKEWGFGLTTVAWRKNDLKKRLQKSADRISGAEEIKLSNTGEDGVNQSRALLGLHTLVTNVNVPNRGQIPNLPLGAVVETNAVFREDSVIPCQAGEIPLSIYSLIARVVGEQEVTAQAIVERDLDKAFLAFTMDNLVTVNLHDARRLFDRMVKNTEAYLTEYLH